MIPDELEFITTPQNNAAPSQGINEPPPQARPQIYQPQNVYYSTDNSRVNHTVGEYASIWHGGFPGEPSLFEELGIHNSDVKANLKSILNPKKVPRNVDSNFLISILFFIAYAFLLLFLGKPRFGLVYMVAVVGCSILYFAFHNMALAASPENEFTVSILVSAVAYCLPPLVPVLVISRIFKLRIFTITIFSIPFVSWSSYCSGRYLFPLTKVSSIELLVVPLYLFYSYLLLLPLI